MKQQLQQNFWMVFCGIFALVGTVMGVVFTYLMFNLYQLRTDGIRTRGEVIDVTYSNEGGASPTVSFTTRQGETIQHNPGVFTSPPEYQPGDQVTLWYRPGDPQHPVLKGAHTWLAPLITGIFFLVFGGIGYGGLMRQFASKKEKKWLLQNGTSVEATFVEVRYNTQLSVGNEHPYVIVGQWLDNTSNKLYTFESDHIWFNPEPYVQQRNLRVMIDPKDPSKYIMDLSFLPEPGN